MNAPKTCPTLLVQCVGASADALLDVAVSVSLKPSRRFVTLQPSCGARYLTRESSSATTTSCSVLRLHCWTEGRKRRRQEEGRAKKEARQRQGT
jgi:hypothetical protein